MFSFLGLLLSIWQYSKLLVLLEQQGSHLLSNLFVHLGCLILLLLQVQIDLLFRLVSNFLPVLELSGAALVHGSWVPAHLVLLPGLFEHLHPIQVFHGN